MTKLFNEQYYLDKIKNAKSSEELHEINYDYLCNTKTQILSKDNDLITGLCVYKECLLKGEPESELQLCIKSLKLPKAYCNKIK